MTYLTAVFSYNRGRYLWNCVRSLEEFAPDATVVVFDDRSDDRDTREALDRIRARGHEVFVNEEASNALNGNLRLNMTRALDLARDRDVRLLHLVQEDTQLVWRDEMLAARVRAVLDEFPRAWQVMAHFWKRLSFAHAEPVPERRIYKRRRGGDLGFVDVQRLQERGFRFEHTEYDDSARLCELGLEAYALADPVVARIPWPAHAPHGVMRGKVKPAQRELFVKPLVPAALSRLSERPLSLQPYAEDYCVPWGWRCWKPYPTGPSYKSWLKAIATVSLRQRTLKGLIPQRVGGG
jgi:hypothetical protein